jgi:NAD(P)-dependent dehydrogenase (short-subunit alcohol dehydrogenase family)
MSLTALSPYANIVPAPLSALGQELNVAVFGANGGIGGGFVDLLLASDQIANVHAFSRSTLDRTNSKLCHYRFDFKDESSIASGFEAATQAGGPLHLILVATGVLHQGEALQPEKSMRSLSAESLTKSYLINTIGPSLIAKHGLPRLAKDRKTAFAALSARVGSITDNKLGGWHSYRASKAALNQILRTLSAEHRLRNPKSVILALHPGTVDTGLSKPFQSGYGGGSGKTLFSKNESACRLLEVIAGAEPYCSGGLFDYAGLAIPF